MRCPFRMKGFDQPDTCDEKCAWLMRVIDYDQRNSRVCAMSVIAMRDEMNEWIPANITDVDANDGLAVENDVSEASVDANDGSADTREELEADVLEIVKSGFVRYEELIALLDRQAYITRRETVKRQEVFCDTCESVTDEHANELQKRCDELQAKVDELTAERDEWRARAAEEAANAEGHRRNANNIAEECDARARALDMQLKNIHNLEHERDELRKHVDELTAELTAARNAHAQAEYDVETYREKLGRMLDNAHEITRIGGDC